MAVSSPKPQHETESKARKPTIGSNFDFVSRKARKWDAEHLLWLSLPLVELICKGFSLGLAFSLIQHAIHLHISCKGEKSLRTQFESYVQATGAFQSAENDDTWRRPPKLKGDTKPTCNNGDNQGISMSIFMVPCLLISMSIWNPNWMMYAKLSRLFAPLVSTEVSIGLIAMTCALDSSCRSIEFMTGAICFAIFRLSKTIMSHRSSTRVLTYGEWHSLSHLLAIVLSEFIIAHKQKDEEISFTEANLSDSVSMAGFVGCCTTCCAVFFLQKAIRKLPRFQKTTNSLFLPYKIFLLVSGPLLVVEMMLICSPLWTEVKVESPFGLQFPRCISWLTSFLLENEESHFEHNGFPRWYGLVYWVAAIGILLGPTLWLNNQSRPSRTMVVITRKWFHLIAIVLFTPTTLYLQQLMSLAYTIAVCMLLVFELVRRDMPALQEFYVHFVDTSKDDSDAVVISHVFLVAGCAAPLWISQALALSNSDPLLQKILPFWGIACLGVGDAMGALCGTKYGKKKWGKNDRTVEGFVAMWTGTIVYILAIVVISGVPHSHRLWNAILVANTLVALLESFSWQMDNLFLPLVGATIILFMA